MVDFPLPDGPVSTAFCPGFTSKLTFRSALLCGSYSNDTFSKTMCPLKGGATTASGSSLTSRGVASKPRIRSPDGSETGSQIIRKNDEVTRRELTVKNVPHSKPQHQCSGRSGQQVDHALQP